MNHQGKRKDQVEFASKVTFYSIIGIFALVIILAIVKSIP
jgi:hypothetical protein